jgi:benzoate/toluate 1,2-dioxygenase beta subunit
VPAQVGQPGPERALSLFYEHKPLLAVRIARLQEATPHARTPASRTHHQVSALSVQRALTPGADFEAISSLIVCEWRQDEGRWFAGTVRHGLRRHEQTLRITFKEVRLINCDAPHRALMVPF